MLLIHVLIFGGALMASANLYQKNKITLAYRTVRQVKMPSAVKEIVIISGDYAQPTRLLASALGIEHYFAETLPEDKGKLIEQLQDEGKRVCFVGDGINDTIAMKKSEVSVSLRGATTAAIDTAQVVLMAANLEQLTELFDLAQQHKGNMRLTAGTILSGAGTSIIGALFFGTGIQFTSLVNQVVFPVSVVSAMSPTLRISKEFASQRASITNSLTL